MRTFHTKFFTALLLILISAMRLTAGTPAGTFIVTNNGAVADVNPYITAIANADMESFRYQNKRCTIVFDNGLQVELLSATEVQALGIQINISEYKSEDTSGWIQPVFHLNNDGTLSAMYTKPDLKQRTTTH
jgi:hypothetical protein